MKIALIICAALLAGCGKTTETQVTVIKVFQEGKWGCIGEDQRTILETEEGFRDSVCGNWGEPGDKFTAYYVSGHIDHVANGIKINR